MKMFAIPGGLEALQAAAAATPPTRPLPEAQIMELDDRLARMDEITVAVGDIVVEKVGLGWLEDVCRTNMPMKIIRMLDVNNLVDRASMRDFPRRVQTDRVDCVVCYMTDDGGNVHFSPHRLGFLTKFNVQVP